LSDALQESSVTALVLLGFENDREAEQVLRKIAELRDAKAERLAAITGFVSALYPPGSDGTPRIRPGMIGEWFVVSQLTARPALAQALRVGLTEQQAARALSFLASAADRTESAAGLFGEFAAGNPRGRILAAAHAAMTGHAGRQLLDPVIAEQVRASDEWTIEQLTELNRLIPAHVLLLTHVALADCTVELRRAEATDGSAVHQADLALAVQNLGAGLQRVGRYPEALSARTEATDIFRQLASKDPDLYQQEYQQKLGALRREYDQHGLHQDAVLHHLAHPAPQPPPPSPPV